MTTVTEILSLLSTKRFDLHDEKKTQAQIAEAFQKANIPFKREYPLGANSRPDFFIDGIAIEIKIKGNAREIYRQCERYCGFDQVTHIILVTNRSMGFPPSINGRWCFVVKLGAQWL